MSTNMITRVKRTKKGTNVLETAINFISTNKSNDCDEFYLLLDSAKREWLDAQIYFDNVSEPELVDYAIHKMEASEAKYMYLLNQAKKESYSVDLSKII